MLGYRLHNLARRLPYSNPARAYNRVMRLTAAISREGDWFVAQCLEADVASQGSTFEEAREDLAEALALFFEDGNIEVGERPVITPIDVAV